MKKEEFVIYYSKTGNIKYSLMSLILVMIDIICLFVKFDMVMILEIFMKIILFIGALFFGYAFIFFCKRVFNKSEMLIIDSKGITDNSSAISLGFIPWEEIDSAYIGEVLENRFIELKIKDEEKYLNNLSFLKKFFINYNRKIGHEISCITLNTTDYSLDEVLTEIKIYMAKYKK